MRKGYSIIELLLVAAILAILFGFLMMNLPRVTRTSTLTGELEKMVADIKLQQTNAMSGERVGGQSVSGYGVRFETDRYILFFGTSYSSNDANNRVTLLDSHVEISSVTFSNTSVVFAPMSGEVVGYATAASSLVLREKDDDRSQSVSMNAYGVITTAY